MELHDFETIVQEAISALPQRIREELKDIVVVIEDRPPTQANCKGLLLGLYEGVPLTAWGRSFGSSLPDKITLYRETIEHVGAAGRNVPAIIRETLWHEIGHAFGFDHARIQKMEERWRRKRAEDGEQKNSSDKTF